MGEKNEVKKLSTGIKELDNMLSGGIPEGCQVLILGDGGSGKTLLSFYIAYNMAKSGTTTTFVTTEGGRPAFLTFVKEAFSELDDIDSLLEAFKLNVDDKKSQFQFQIKDQSNIQAILSNIVSTVEDSKSDFLVIDSLSGLRALYTDDRAYTRGLNYLVENIRSQKLTCLITEETMKNSDKPPGLLQDSMLDGIIRLRTFKSGGGVAYTANVTKLRYSKYKTTTANFTITPKGIVMSTKQRPMSEATVDQ